MERLTFPPIRRLPPLAGDQFQAAWEKHFRDVMQRADDAWWAQQVRLSYPSSDLTITGRASDATVVISAHTRVYPAGDKSVQAGGCSAPSYGSTYYISYVDATREGGLVVYSASTSWTDAFPNAANPNRHFVGKVTMPANGAASNTTGTPARPPGWV